MRTLKTTPRSPLAGLGPAIDWLHSRGISAPHLASLLKTTPENIRAIACRRRRASRNETFLPARFFNLEADVAEQQRRILPIRDDHYSGPEEGYKGRKSIPWLEEQIVRCVSAHSKQYEFLKGADALKKLLPYSGNLSDVRRIRLLARLHRHRAWFLVHTGRAASALESALLALDLAQYCYRESVYDRTHIQEVIESAQIASNAALLSEQPILALRILEIVEAAYEKLDEDPGSEYHRQSGTAYFQQGATEPARTHFDEAMVAMEERGEARNRAHLLMTGTRHLNLLPEFDWDRSQQIHRTAIDEFGPESLERAINVNWTVACGMATASPDVRKEARELLDKSPPVPTLFAHQSTVRTLLAITPELGLNDEKRYEWIRRTLYENALRNR